MRPAQLLLIGTLATASACSVYTPLQPHAPLIRARGEGELGLQMEAHLRPTLQAAYSPADHFLLLASGTWRPSLPLGQNDAPDNYRTRQYEIGAGGYWPAGPNWTATATIGTGAAQVQRNVSESGIFVFNNDYTARYRKNFGQMGFVRQGERSAVGFGYRLVQAQFTELTADGYNGIATLLYLPLETQYRHEPYFFLRGTLDGPLAQSRWQFQLGSTLSFCVPGRTGNDGTLDPVAFCAQFNRGSLLLLNAGIMYCLKKRPAAGTVK